MAVTHATALRTDFANLATGTTTTFAAGTGQKIIIYSGTAPTNANTALSGNTAIATITALTWGAGSAGVATLSGSTADSAAVGGTASFYRRTKSDGTTVIEQGLCGTSGSDMNLSSLTIAAGANVSITSGTYTASA
jgi:hypothetical protein